MISRSNNVDRFEPVQQGSLTGNRGIDYTKPITADNVADEISNLTVESDGTLSIRKPIVALKSYDVTHMSGGKVVKDLKCERVVQLYTGKHVLAYYVNVNPTHSTFADHNRYIAILSDYETTPIKLNLECEHYITYKPSKIEAFTCVSVNGVNYYPIDDSMDISNLSETHTVSSTILGNCTVDLTHAWFAGNLYDSKIIEVTHAKKAPRYLQIFNSPTDSSLYIIRIKTPEVNLLDKGADIPLNPNLALDNPYAVRDEYNSPYVDISGIQMYAPAVMSAQGTLENTVVSVKADTVDIPKFAHPYAFIHSAPCLRDFNDFKSNNGLQPGRHADFESYKSSNITLKLSTEVNSKKYVYKRPTNVVVKINMCKCKFKYVYANATKLTNVVDVNNGNYVDILNMNGFLENPTNYKFDIQAKFDDSETLKLVNKSTYMGFYDITYGDRYKDVYKDDIVQGTASNGKYFAYCSNDYFYKECCASLAHANILNVVTRQDVRSRYIVDGNSTESSYSVFSNIGAVGHSMWYYKKIGSYGGTYIPSGTILMYDCKLSLDIILEYGSAVDGANFNAIHLGTYTMQTHPDNYDFTNAYEAATYNWNTSTSGTATKPNFNLTYSNASISWKPAESLENNKYTRCISNNDVSTFTSSPQQYTKTADNYTLQYGVQHTVAVNDTSKIFTCLSKPTISCHGTVNSIVSNIILNLTHTDDNFNNQQAYRTLNIEENNLATTSVSKEFGFDESYKYMPFIDVEHISLKNNEYSSWDGISLSVIVYFENKLLDELRVLDLTESALSTKFNIVENIESVLKDESNIGIRILKAFMKFPELTQTAYYCFWECSMDGVNWENVYSSVDGKPDSPIADYLETVRYPKYTVSETSTISNSVLNVSENYDVRFAQKIDSDNMTDEALSPTNAVYEEYSGANDVPYKVKRHDCLIIAGSSTDSDERDYNDYGVRLDVVFKNPIFRYTVCDVQDLYEITKTSVVKSKADQNTVLSNSTITNILHKLPAKLDGVDSVNQNMTVDSVETYTASEETDNTITDITYRITYYGKCVSKIYAQQVYTPSMAPKWSFAQADIQNAVLGTKLNYNNCLYSYADAKFLNNITVSDANSFITPMLNTVDLKVSNVAYVTQLISWRDYLIATTPDSIHLVKNTAEGSYSKIISSSVGVSSNDGRTCRAIHNGIIFKSGTKIYTLNPNAASGDDTILNLNDISKPISHLLENIDVNTSCFAFNTERDYYLFIPSETYTTCVKYSFDNRVWTMYTYPVKLYDYTMHSVNDIRLWGVLNDSIIEYQFDKYVHEAISDFEKKFNLTEYDAIPYGDYLTVDSVNYSTKTLSPTPIEFKFDTGQRVDNIIMPKQFIETKLILATRSEKPAVNMTTSVFVDGVPVKYTPKGNGMLYKTAASQILTLGDSIVNNNDSVMNTLSQAYLKYSGKGKTIRHVVRGTSLYNFKIYEVLYRYRVLPEKS